jgi:hypothetical protein
LQRNRKNLEQASEADEIENCISLRIPWVHLIQVHRRTKQALEVAQAGCGEPALAWIAHYEETLVGVEAALAIDDDPTVGDGAAVQPFKDRSSRFQAL